MSAHSVFVLDMEGKPLTPTIPARARKLLRGGVAKKVWSKFGTFGIQMLVETRREIPKTVIGVDTGSKFEGYAVICGQENSLSVKLDLPDKKNIVRKLDERHRLRRTRRKRKCRRRPARFDNRSREGFIAPSQAVIIGSRLKVLKALFRIYSIQSVGLEDVRFNHAKYRWGKHFSTAEIGKQRLRDFFKERDAEVFEYQGWETKALREKYEYRKTSNKSEDCFEAHCSDALALACQVGLGDRVTPGQFLVVDDTYQSVRRKLHYTQPAAGGLRKNYSRGTVRGLRKGLLIGTPRGKSGYLCGELRDAYRYYDATGKRQQTKQLAWVSSQFIIRNGGEHRCHRSKSLNVRRRVL